MYEQNQEKKNFTYILGTYPNFVLSRFLRSTKIKKNVYCDSVLDIETSRTIKIKRYFGDFDDSSPTKWFEL